MKIFLLDFDFVDTSTVTMFLSVETHTDRGTNTMYGESHKTDNVLCV